MKSAALLITLILHATGLWSHTPETTRTTLTNTATSDHKVPAREPAPQQPLVMPALPVHITQNPLSLDAASAIAVDATTGTILYSKEPGAQRPVASITKLVTSLVILSRHSPDERVTIPTLPTYQTADETIGLQPGETYTIGDLLKAALIQSANDAADAMAIIDAGTTQKFAAEMNTKMGEWGITNTRFSNPTGLQDKDNFSTAEALAKIGQLALVSPFARQTVSLGEATITSSTGRVFNLKTTNQLLASGQFYGIKTGYTPAAGECFVGLTRIQGHEVITVVLGAGDRFAATETLTNWIGQNWQWL